MTRGSWAIAFLLTMAGSLCLAQSEPQSLADVAKKVRSEKKAALTLSDDNFVRRAPVESKTSVSAAGSPASAGDAQSASAASAKSEAKTGKTQEDAKKESSKKEEELKKQLDSYKADRDAWNRSAQRYEDLLANEPDQFRRQMYQDALDNDRRNVSFYQNKIDEAAAKAGTAPGAAAEKADEPTSGNKP